MKKAESLEEAKKLLNESSEHLLVHGELDIDYTDTITISFYDGPLRGITATLNEFTV